MPDAATVATRGTFGSLDAGTSETQVITSGGTILYGIAYHVTVAGPTPTHRHSLTILDNDGKTILEIGLVAGKLNGSGSAFQVPIMIEGVNVKFTASSSASSEIEYVVWTDGSHVRATEQQ